jgi:hypothetical protein
MFNEDISSKSITTPGKNEPVEPTFKRLSVADLQKKLNLGSKLGLEPPKIQPHFEGKTPIKSFNTKSDFDVRPTRGVKPPTLIHHESKPYSVDDVIVIKPISSRGSSLIKEVILTKKPTFEVSNSVASPKATPFIPFKLDPDLSPLTGSRDITRFKLIYLHFF